ncbi:MAG: hypothetical protein WC475_02550 [Candidatus Paceibacterota bacterium]
MAVKKNSGLQYVICVSGASETGHCALGAVEKAQEIGREIARQGFVLVTGATTGMPYWAAKGAKEAGGTVIGFSPAASKLSHQRTYHLPIDYHDIIVYTGFGYSGRNLLLTRASDAVILICGRMGTLNEFTIAFEDQKPIGVLEGTGGTADIIEDLIVKSYRGPGKIAYDSEPAGLLKKVAQLIKEEEI